MEKLDKRTRILMAAEILFAEQGFEGTSTRQIARKAGANMAMISYYYGSKEGVFMEIVSNRIADFTIELKSIRDNQLSPMEKLIRVVDGYTNRILSNIPFHRMMQRELSMAQRPEMFSQIKEAMLANLNVIENIVNEGIANGHFRPVDVRMLIASIMGTISNVVIFPFKITAGSKLDINHDEDRKILSDRLILHLNNLLKTYLTPQ